MLIIDLSWFIWNSTNFGELQELFVDLKYFDFWRISPLSQWNTYKIICTIIIIRLMNNTNKCEDLHSSSKSLVSPRKYFAWDGKNTYPVFKFAKILLPHVRWLILLIMCFNDCSGFSKVFWICRILVDLKIVCEFEDFWVNLKNFG